MSALHICLSAHTAPVFLSRARRTLPKAPSPRVLRVTVNWSSERPGCPRWKEKPGIASAGASESRSIAETASDTSCPVAVYFRSASSESSGPSRRRKQPRSMRTSLQRASAAETVAIVGAPVLSDSSPK